nr:uncharacterized protein LOC123761655 [Procambarus clarkii]
MEARRAETCSYGRQLGPDGRYARPGNDSLERDVSMIWTVGMEEMLIYFVRANRMLWDPKHPHYTKPILKRRKVEDIAAIIKRETASEGEYTLTPVDVWKKYRNLRNSFLRELKRASDKRRETGNNTHTSSWVHFNRMRFLLSVANVNSNSNLPATAGFQVRSQLSSVKDENHAISSAIHDERSRLEQECQEGVRVGGEWASTYAVSATPSAGLTRPTASAPSQPVQSHSDNEPQLNAKKRSSISSSRAMNSDDLERAAKILRKLEKDPDVAESFGKFVAASIRKLPEASQHNLMSKITRVMSEFHTTEDD